jgi:hypothetical protein
MFPSIPIVLQAGTEAQLDADIAEANAASAGNYIIDLTTDIVETSDPTAVDLNSNVHLTLSGGGSGANVLDGAGNHRGLFVYSGAVTIDNLTLQELAAVGGSGSQGGGGGAGLGGAVYIAAGGAVTLVNGPFILTDSSPRTAKASRQRNCGIERDRAKGDRLFLI